MKHSDRCVYIYICQYFKVLDIDNTPIYFCECSIISIQLRIPRAYIYIYVYIYIKNFVILTTCINRSAEYFS